MTISVRKATWLSSLGAGLEYYDFIVYGMMVSYLNNLFFSGETWTNVIKAFGVFAVGYGARPFGGILFGMIGDTLGRKNTFVSVMLLMSISTFAIGCLPTFATIGTAAAVLLIAFRLLQGLSFGAELPGAITVVNEYAKTQKSAFSGFVVSSVSVGSILASAILYILAKSVDSEAILQWGWRIPFLLGGLLALANYFIRKQLEETPAFSSLPKRQTLKEPLICLFRSHRRSLAAGLAMTVFIASLVIFNLYLPTFLSAHYGYVLSDVYLAMTWGLVWSALSLPICGYLVDRWGQYRTFLVTCLVFMIIANPLFDCLKQGHLMAFMVIDQTIISFFMTSYFPLLANAFSTEVRYTGIAFCYNVIYAIMGLAPIGFTYWIQKTQNPKVMIWVLMMAALVSLAGVIALRRKPAI